MNDVNVEIYGQIEHVFGTECLIKGVNRKKRVNNRHFDHIFLGFFLESGTFTTVFLIKFAHYWVSFISESNSMTTPQIDKLRNIAIIAHVDHGKTTLVDKLLQQSGTLESRGEAEERVMDSNDIEKERGITILAKNTAINWNDYRINIVDTPGHADFGGEVERIMSMVDSVLLIVDAVDGPMPQTRFVTQKAFSHGLKPIVVINKVDRPGARPDWVMDQIFDLFDNLGATDEQLDFKVVYASALNGWASMDEGEVCEKMEALLQAIVYNVE